MVERGPEKAGVVSPILTLGTTLAEFGFGEKSAELLFSPQPSAYRKTGGAGACARIYSRGNQGSPYGAPPFWQGEKEKPFLTLSKRAGLLPPSKSGLWGPPSAACYPFPFGKNCVR